MERLASLCVTAVLVLGTADAYAQSRCSLPVSAFVTDDAGERVDGTIDIELNFFVDDAPDATPA